MCGLPPGDNGFVVSLLDSFWCFEWSAVSLSDDQLKTAKAKALTLAEQ